MQEPEDILRSIPETAKRLGGVSVWSVYKWLDTGRLRKTRVGTRVMVAESDVQRFLLESALNPKRGRKKKTEETAVRDE